MHWISNRSRHDTVPMYCGWLRMLLLVSGMFTSFAGAAELETPADRAILTVTGSISITNDGPAATFDRAMLTALPQITIRTVTPWTEGLTEFEGPYARDVMAKVGATGTKVVATAINDYQIEIPLSDFEKIPVIMALARDGQPMGVRNKGPIWIIYPWSDQPELQTEIFHSRSIWQVKALEVK